MCMSSLEVIHTANTIRAALHPPKKITWMWNRHVPGACLICTSRRFWLWGSGGAGSRSCDCVDFSRAQFHFFREPVGGSTAHTYCVIHRWWSCGSSEWSGEPHSPSLGDQESRCTLEAVRVRVPWRHCSFSGSENNYVVQTGPAPVREHVYTSLMLDKKCLCGNLNAMVIYLCNWEHSSPEAQSRPSPFFFFMRAWGLSILPAGSPRTRRFIRGGCTAGAPSGAHTVDKCAPNCTSVRVNM